MKKVLISKEGYVNLENKIVLLKSKRKEISERLKEAMAFGDLAENAEYEDARNAQIRLEQEISQLENALCNTELVDEDDFKGGVNIGNVVTVKMLDNNEELTFTLVTTTEIDIYKNKLSNMSPIGEAILHKNIGDVVTVKSPNGIYDVKILEIR